MPLNIIRIFLPVIWGVIALAMGSLVGAAELNPAQVETGILVNSISLEGFSSIDDYPVSIAEVRSEIDRQRAQYDQRMTVDEIHRVADAMTLYFRRQGYVFHSVYLPPQTVNNGIVELALQEGRLASVHVINESPWPERRYARLFEPLVGDLLYGPDVETRVQALKMQSGFSVFPFYSRGKNPGEARLNLRVTKTRKRQFSLKADNFGSEVSGQYRVVGQYTEHQLTGHFDHLSMAVLRSVDDVPNTYGSIQYTLPFGGLRYALDVGISNNQFELGDRYADLGLEGDALIARAGVSRYQQFDPSRRSRLRLEVFSKSNNLDSDMAAVDEETSQGVTLEWYKDKRFNASGGILNGYVGLSHGQFDTDDTDTQAFNKLDVSLLAAKSLAGSGRWRSVVQANLRGQYTDVNLPSVEGFALSGPYGVRGFEPGLYNADRALLVSAQWSLPNSLIFDPEADWRMEPLLYGDYALGSEVASSVGSTRAQFSGWGAGVRFGWGSHISGQFSLAVPINGEIDNNTVDGDELWLFEIRWH